jgi:hypothetical protein
MMMTLTAMMMKMASTSSYNNGVRSMSLLLLVLLIILSSEKSNAKFTPPSEYPTKITLRTGVLHAPPFAYVTELEDGSFEYTGFQPDLLRQMVAFAEADNVKLEILMSPSPLQYNDAFDRVANDCNTTSSPQNLTYEQCNEFDLMSANYYATSSRAMRAHLSAPILRSTISTVKYVNKSPGAMDFTTLSQAESAGATVCLKDGTFYAGLVQAKFPGAKFLMCPSQDECLAALKAEECVLSADDELQIRFRVAWDETLDVTPEHFNTQYIVWALKDDLPPITLRLFKKWMYDANTNATNDALYSKYFQKALCPVGTAGESCELPCDPDHGAANSRGVCVCSSTKWSGDDCSIEVPENVNLIPVSLKLSAYAMVGINVVTILAAAAWLAWQRNTQQVRVSQPSFLVLVLVGCLISSSTIVVLAQEDAGDGPVSACMAIPWLYSFGFSVTFGTLFAKIRRVYILFKSAGDATRTRPEIISVKETLGLIGGVLLVDVAILVVWTVMDPLRWERWVISADQFGAPLESEGSCYSDLWSIFGGVIALLHLLLMAVACILCYVARDIPTRFQEGKYVSIAMISNLQIFVVGVPILIILGTDPQTSFFVRSVIIWMNDFAVVTLIFGNLIYQVHFDPKRTNTEVLRSKLDTAINRYSVGGPAPKSRQSRISFSVDEQHANMIGTKNTLSDSAGRKDNSNDTYEGQEGGYVVGTILEHDHGHNDQEDADDGDSDGMVSRIGITGEIEKFRPPAAPTPVVGEQASNKKPQAPSEADDDDEGDDDKEAPLPPMNQPPYFQRPVDVLKDNKGSWAHGTTSTIVRGEKEDKVATAPRLPPIIKKSSFQRPVVDVLKDNKGSWAHGTMSTIMRGDDDE